MAEASARRAGRTAASSDDDNVVAGVEITHPDRVVYPSQGVTKLDLARYYESIAPAVMPWIKRRPLTLLRCPEGRHKECFYQKHPYKTLARQVPRVSIPEKSGQGEYLYVEEIADVVTLVQWGTLEFHAWGCQVDDVEHPDLMVFDLDPADDVAWSEMVNTARGLRDRIDQLGLHSFLRTTGGKGLHLVVPLQPSAGWDEVKAFSRAVAERYAEDEPERLTVNMSKAKRKGRIFIDYLRNGRGNTAIANFSARVHAGAPVAVPIRWDELDAKLTPNKYRITNLGRRLSALRQDPWSGFEEARKALTADLFAAVGLNGDDYE